MKIIFNKLDILFYIFLFICLFTSNNWSYQTELTEGELFRFDNILLFGQINVYYLFAFLFFIILFFSKFGNTSLNNILGENNYLKNIMLAFFIPVNILLYLTIYIKEISVADLGLRPIMTFFIYLVFTFYIQDIFLKNKDSDQLKKSLIVFEIIILFRALYSIIKYFLGFGRYIKEIGSVRLGQENDFADFFLLILIISLTLLAFDNNQYLRYKLLHIASIIASASIIIFSFRRYIWIEFLVVIGILLFLYSPKYKSFYKKIILISFLFMIIITILLFTAPADLVDNPYIGRFLTSLSIIDKKFESDYGTDTNHLNQIIEGWENVKNHWLLGVTPYGEKFVKRITTAEGLYIHNAFLGIWFVYGITGLLLYCIFYIKTIRLGYKLYFLHNNNVGLILFIFMIAQLVKNIIWQGVIVNINITVIYIFIISLAIKTLNLETSKIQNQI